MTTTTPTAELTSDQAVNLARSLGRKITLTTWRGYVHRGEAPGPARHVGRTPLWDEAEIRDWAADPAAWRTRTQQAAIDAAVAEARRQIVAALEAEAHHLATDDGAVLAAGVRYAADFAARIATQSATQEAEPTT